MCVCQGRGQGRRERDCVREGCKRVRDSRDHVRQSRDNVRNASARMWQSYDHVGQGSAMPAFICAKAATMWAKAAIKCDTLADFRNLEGSERPQRGFRQGSGREGVG